MNIKIIAIGILFLGLIMTSCNGSSKAKHNVSEELEEHSSHNESEEDHNYVHDESTEGMAVISQIQRDAINLKVGKIEKREMSGIIKTSGKLVIAPNDKAEINSSIGANVKSINVFQGDKVKKGQILATLEHPDIIQLQEEFIVVYNTMLYLKSEYNRQKELYLNNVGSGKKFQKVEADFNSAKAKYNGLKLRLQLLKLDVKAIQEGNIFNKLNIYSPIEGYVSDINISLGSYIDSKTKMFDISNLDNIHADLAVYEKDINRVRIGQYVRLNITGSEEFVGEVFAIEKAFNTDSRSVIIHVKIPKSPASLIVGSYVSGEILTGTQKVFAVPESAVVNDGDSKYIFVVDKKLKDTKVAYRLVEVIPGIVSNNFIRITINEDLSPDALIVLKGAYYLMSDLKKSEAEHHH